MSSVLPAGVMHSEHTVPSSLPSEGPSQPDVYCLLLIMPMSPILLRVKLMRFHLTKRMFGGSAL